MPARGLGSTFRPPPLTGADQSELRARVDALEAAVRAARGRLGDDVLDRASEAVERARGRLQVSTDHTIVALAGATGSGKSSLFNALAGSTLSTSGPERPTTSSTSALVCGDDDIGDLLDWLGVPVAQRHRGTDTGAPGPGRLPSGLVLLDLPDHDSIEVTHHEEAERVVALADLLVWVVDPQKYADSALHHRLLQPHARHREVMLVVLNHIDTVPDERRQSMLRDVRKVVTADGIRDPLILATSAREGTGLPDLLAAIRRRVEEKRHVAMRVRADLVTAAAELRSAAGEAPPAIPDLWAGHLQQRLAEAAGVPGRVARGVREVREDVLRRTRWPAGGTPPDGVPGQRPQAAVDRSAAEAAARDLADNVCRDLTPAWADPIRRAATAELSTACDRLESDLTRPPEARLPGWVALIRPTAMLLGLCLVAGVALLVLRAAGSVGSWWDAVALLVLGGVGVAALRLGAPALAGRAATEATEPVDRSLRGAVSRVAGQHVLGPVNAELRSFHQFRRGLDVATRT